MTDPATPRAFRVVCWAVPGDSVRWAVVTESFADPERWDVHAVYDLRSTANEHVREVRRRQQELISAERSRGADIHRVVHR